MVKGMSQDTNLQRHGALAALDYIERHHKVYFRCLSTVLAQDHFFSDSSSLHLTIKTHKVTMMMLIGAGS